MRTRAPKERIGEEWTSGHVVTRLVRMEGYAEISVKSTRLLGMRMDGIKVDDTGTVCFMHPQIGEEIKANVGSETASQLQGKGSKNAVIEVLSALRDEFLRMQGTEGGRILLETRYAPPFPLEGNHQKVAYVEWEPYIKFLDRAVASLVNQ